MQKRHLFGAIATFVGGPLLLAMMIEPAASTSPDTSQALPAAVGSVGVIATAGSSPAAAAPALATAEIAKGSGALTGLASVAQTHGGVGATGAESGDAPLPAGFFHKLGYAGSTDDAYANALPDSDFSLPDGGLALDGPATAAGFEALPEANADLLSLTGFAAVGGAGGGGAGAPPAFAATEQVQLVSGVPEPTSWVSFIIGLGLIGFNLRDRNRMRHVVC